MKDFRPDDWQGVRIPKKYKRPLFGVVSADTKKLPPRSWITSAHVCTSQGNDPACVGFGTANWVEHMLGDQLPKAKQIDGRAIWYRARQLFYQNFQGGLTLEEGVAAAVEMGILPPNSKAREIAGWAAINAQLEKSPLIQAHLAHEGWNQPDSKSGCLDHSKNPTSNTGGHCTLMIGMGYQMESDKVFTYSQNSWGADWGKLGFFTMTLEEHDEGAPVAPITIDLSQPLTKWQGWKKYVI